MANQVTNYKCPACGGPLHYAGASGRLECDYCSSSYAVDEIEAQIQAQNDDAMAGGQWQMADFASNWGEPGMKTYACPSCGAELICDESTAATCCPYCGNQAVIPGQFAGSLKPEFVLPFQTDREQAKAALKNHYKGKRLLPRSFVSENHIEDIQGVYVPFWLFDCTAVGEVTYRATKTSRRDMGDREVITTQHYEVRRAGALAFDKVPVDASIRMPDGHMDSLEPYDYAQLKPFSMAYMPGFLANRYDMGAAECGRRMAERCEKTFADEARKTISGYDAVNETSRRIQMQKGAAHYAMLPVWLLATQWNGKDFLFAMNGQSGKLVGDLPVDKGKYWGAFGGIAAALIAIMLLLNQLVFAAPMSGLTMGLVCIALPLLIAFIAVSVMKGQMRSVAVKQQAAKYMMGGLRLSRRQDLCLNTTTETRTKPKPAGK